MELYVVGLLQVDLGVIVKVSLDRKSSVDTTGLAHFASDVVRLVFFIVLQ